MSALGLLVGVACVALAVFGLLRFSHRRGSGKVDLGTLSDQWRAQQRASPPDSSF
ncbi:MAG TPA: hypothetical protein VM818_11805 [Vicinamibacterales bacterium]|nr:hypothetical protein [Vicinamibacterales bacterium]